MIIENARTTLFQTKEDYLAFRQAWKDFHNSGKAKPTFTTFEGTYEKYEPGKGYIKVPYTRRDKSKPLSSYHYMLYNILRGKYAETGYTPIQNKNKLNGNRYWPASSKYNSDPNPYQAMHCAAVNLLRTLSRLKSDKPLSSWEQSSIDDLLLPFGNTISKESLIAIYEPLHTWIKNGFVDYVEVKEAETVS
jgi:hypothetical protein